MYFQRSVKESLTQSVEPTRKHVSEFVKSPRSVRPPCGLDNIILLAETEEGKVDIFYEPITTFYDVTTIPRYHYMGKVKVDFK